ncbi:unnamed protein product [Amaranthus hypochondriacus]
MTSEPVLPSKGSRPAGEAEVHSDQDTADNHEVETYTAADGSFRTKHTRSKDKRERAEQQAGPNHPVRGPLGLTPASEGATPVSRDELVNMMMSFKGEIKDLLDNTAGPRKGQAEEKRLGKKTATTVKGRASTPDPKSNMPARPIDFSKIHTPMDRARKPVRHIQPDGTKKVYSDARTLIQDKKTQQRSESASTSTFRDNFNVTSGRHSRTNNDSRTSEVSARSGPHIIQPALHGTPYTPFGSPYAQPGLFGGQQQPPVQPMDWQLRLLNLGEQQRRFPGKSPR